MGAYPVWPLAQGMAPPLALPASGGWARKQRAGRLCSRYCASNGEAAWPLDGLAQHPAVRHASLKRLAWA